MKFINLKRSAFKYRLKLLARYGEAKEKHQFLMFENMMQQI